MLFPKKLPQGGTVLLTALSSPLAEDQPVEEIALTTIKLMFEILEGERKHLRQVFEGELMVKESTVKQSLP